MKDEIRDILLKSEKTAPLGRSIYSGLNAKMI